VNISDLEQGLHWVVSLVVIAYGGTGRWFAFVMNDFFWVGGTGRRVVTL